jgi:hypothetical protein
VDAIPVPSKLAGTPERKTKGPPLQLGTPTAGEPVGWGVGVGTPEGVGEGVAEGEGPGEVLVPGVGVGVGWTWLGRVVALGKGMGSGVGWPGMGFAGGVAGGPTETTGEGVGAAEGVPEGDGVTMARAAPSPPPAAVSDGPVGVLALWQAIMTPIPAPSRIHRASFCMGSLRCG